MILGGIFSNDNLNFYRRNVTHLIIKHHYHPKENLEQQSGVEKRFARTLMLADNFWVVTEMF